MINQDVYMSILHRMHAEESSGDELNLDKLIPEQSEKILSKNISYLINNHLIERNEMLHNLDDTFGVHSLTQLGFDFLSENGGLTKKINEKFNTITIKVDEDQFRALLLERISRSSLPESEKKTIASAIKDLPSEMVTVLATKLFETGLESLMDVLPSIGIG